MALTKRSKYISNHFAIKTLSVIIAFILWFLVTANKEITRHYSLPVQLSNIPSGMTIVGKVPETVEVTVAAPNILFMTHPFAEKPLRLDLARTGEGTIAFSNLQGYLDLPKGMRVVMLFPSSMELKLKRMGSSSSGVFSSEQGGKR